MIEGWVARAREYRLTALSKFLNESRICGNKAIERAPSCTLARHGTRWCKDRPPDVVFPPEISHNAAWLHTARAPPCAGTRNTRYTTLFAKQWSLRRHPTLHSTSPKSPSRLRDYRLSLANKCTWAFLSPGRCAAANYDCPNFLWLTTIRSFPWHRDSPARRTR